MYGWMLQWDSRTAQARRQAGRQAGKSTAEKGREIPQNKNTKQPLPSQPSGPSLPRSCKAHTSHTLHTPHPPPSLFPPLISVSEYGDCRQTGRVIGYPSRVLSDCVRSRDRVGCGCVVGGIDRYGIRGAGGCVDRRVFFFPSQEGSLVFLPHARGARLHPVPADPPPLLALASPSPFFVVAVFFHLVWNVYPVGFLFLSAIGLNKTNSHDDSYDDQGNY
jgi:hypothetical protein